MSKREIIFLKLLFGNKDKDFDFSELLKMLADLGFEMRISGSHHIHWKDGIPEILNLQPNGNKAKPYQVKQVREILQKHKLIPE
jgi:predicted RNA binding protein YcfA (HicA-like mRNA interferase family)